MCWTEVPGAWITDSKYHTQLPFEMASAGPKTLTFMKLILHFSLLHPLGLTLPCWSREAPRRPRPWAQWRTGCRPSAWRDTATTSLPPATPLQRLWSTWHKSEYGGEKLRAEKKEMKEKEKCKQESSYSKWILSRRVKVHCKTSSTYQRSIFLEMHVIAFLSVR